MKIIAVIPAREGSKGIPKKNLYPIWGEPLISYSIKAANRCNRITDVIVSTDGDDIAELSLKYGAKVVKRPREISQDGSPSIDAIIHVLDSCAKSGNEPDVIVLLQPTSPLRSSYDIDRAIDLFISSNDSVISVVERKHPIEWSMSLENDILIPIFSNKNLRNRRQDLKHSYIPNGAIYVSDTQTLRHERTFFSKDAKAYIMPYERSVDIDNLDDVRLAEFYLGNQPHNEIMSPRIKIDNRYIGKKEPCFIIAEAGINHNGNFDTAIKMIDEAVDAGVDAIKFQMYKTEEIITRSAEKATYQKISKSSDDETQFEMIKKYELEDEEYQRLSEYCKKKSITYLSTAFDEISLDNLIAMGVPALKVPSGEINNLQLLRKMALADLPIIMSTGMADMTEVRESYQFLKRCGVKDIVLLHCTSSYPAPLDSINLRAMNLMEREIGTLVGYSDHSEGLIIPLASVAMGACVLEKHFTLDRSMDGPDHKASLNASELKEMVKLIRCTEQALGNGEKKPTSDEFSMKKAARRSLVAIADMCVGHVIEISDISVKRPGTGIEPKFLDNFIGKKVKKEIVGDQLIEWDMIE